MNKDAKQVFLLCASTLAFALCFWACASSTPAAPAASPAEARAIVEFAFVADPKSPAPTGSRTLEYMGKSFTLEPAPRFEIESTSLSSDPMGYPAIAFEIVRSERADFTRWTEERVGRTMAVLIDGEIVMIPRIQSALPGTGLIFSGTHSWSETYARELAARIAPMK